MSKSHRIAYSRQIIPPPPPQIGTSHGGLRDYMSELPKNTASPPKLEYLMEDSGSSGLSFPKMPPPPPPPKLELVIQDLVTSVLSFPRIPPPKTGTSHGGLYRGLVCGDYCCISPLPFGYRLVKIIDTLPASWCIIQVFHNSGHFTGTDERTDRQTLNSTLEKPSCRSWWQHNVDLWPICWIIITLQLN